MRELDYKVWAIEEKSFMGYYCLYDGMVHVACGDQYYLVNNLNASEEHKAKLIAQGIEIKDEFILCQYTSLNDKEGNKIYADWIVKRPSSNGTPDQMAVGVIKFHKGVFYIDFGNGYSSAFLLLFHHNDCTIIGNIYENPELLQA